MQDYLNNNKGNTVNSLGQEDQKQLGAHTKIIKEEKTQLGLDKSSHSNKSRNHERMRSYGPSPKFKASKYNSAQVSIEKNQGKMSS